MDRASSRTKWDWLAVVIAVFLVGAPPIVSALTESAPTLIWETQFNASGASSFEDISESPTCNVPAGRFLLDLDWQTGDVFVAFMEQAQANDEVRVRRLRQSSGAQLWGASFTNATQNLFACSLGVDQRGRVYVAMSSNGPDGVVGKNVVAINKHNGAILATLPASVAGGSSTGGPGSYCGPIVVDVVSNTSDPHPSASMSCGTGATARENWIWKPSSATSYSNVCFSVQANWGPMAWRTDGVKRGLWSVRSTDGITRIDPETCALQGDVTGDSDGREDSGLWFGDYTSNATIDWFSARSGSSTLWVRQRIDADDATDPLTINETKTIGLAGVWGGTGTVGSQIFGYETADDGHALVCSFFSGAGAPFDFFGRLDKDLQNWAWSANFSKFARTIAGCRLGTVGDVFIYGTIQGSPDRAYVRRYCCIDGKARTETVTQAVNASGLTDLPEGVSDLGEGFLVFFQGIGCNSTGSLFFCGLILVIVGMVATGAAFSSTTKSKFLVFLASGLVGVALMIFLTFVSVWPIGATVLLIIAAAGITAFIIRRTFLGA